MQPVQDNSNPLVVSKGNPDLKQEFRHQFRMSFNSYKVLKQRGFYVSAYSSPISKAIVTNNFTDAFGRSVYQYTNVNGNYNFNMWSNYNIKLKKADLGLNFGYRNTTINDGTVLL